MTLVLQACAAQRGVSVALEVPAGSTLSLIGPNGSGKSTVLELIAGVLAADAGRAVLDGRVLFGEGRAVPVHRRGVALLAQDPLLFGHLSVLDNVAFGPRAAGAARAAARRTAAAWLETVGAAQFAGRRPSELSGGQAQRVALARALAADPALLLLDEPLSALDVAAAAQLRHVMGEVLTGRTTILVTHDILDAALLADRVAVLTEGEVVEQGTAAEVMARPRSRFAADFFGWNVLHGTAVSSDAVLAEDGTVVVGQPQAPAVTGRPAIAAFRPAAVSVHLTVPEGSPRNIFAGTVQALEPVGHLVRVRVGLLAADITTAAVAELGLRPGNAVHLAVKAAEVSLYPA